MTFQFTLDQQIRFLQEKGYTVESQTLMDKVVYNGHSEDVPRHVYVTIFRGYPIAEEQGFGTKRVEYCFKQEMIKRLLGF